MPRIKDRISGLLKGLTAISNYILLIPVYIIGVGMSRIALMAVKDKRKKGWADPRDDDDMRRMF